MNPPLLSLNQHIATLQDGPLTLKVNAHHGARICSFAYENKEVLTQPDEHAENFGSTFWDAPQSRWHWPPPVILDSSPYAARITAQQLEFISAVDTVSGLQFSKQIRPFDGVGVEIEYRITNAGIRSITTAAWEVTRAPGGLTFLPAMRLSSMGDSNLPGVQFVADHAWYAIDPLPLPIGKKAFFDGDQGWLAHALPNRMMFIKSFPLLRSDQYSTGHTAVELYAHINGAYVELENHGPRTNLEPGECLNYAVRWFAQPIPAGITLQTGNHALIEFAQEIVHAKKP